MVLNPVRTVRLLNTIYFHGIIAIALNLNFFLLELFILAATAVCLEVLAAIIRFLSSSNGTFTLGAGHFSVLDHGIWSSLATFLKFFFFLLLGFFSSILVAVGSQISLRLLRWEFGWSRSFRVPGD
jgi:hypothetical protein